MGTAIAFAAVLLKYIPLVIQGVTGAISMLEWGSKKVNQFVEEGRDPTPEEWAELNAMTDDLRDMLHSDDR